MSESKTRRDLLALFASFGAGAMSDALAADSPPAVAPGFRVAFENEKVRVLEFRTKPGIALCGVGRHYHPQHLAINLTPSKVRVTLPDGKVIVAESKAGDIFFAPAEWHTVENLGGQPVRGYMVELKDANWKPSTWRGDA
jgi:quercetin dioxygenase-like cupin family protein